MKRPQLVIFDCDGVLVDSERLAIRISVPGLARLGWTMTDGEFVEQFVGRSESVIDALLVKRFGRRVADEWSAEFRRQLDAAIDSGLEAVPGVAQALSEINTPTCVASTAVVSIDEEWETAVGARVDQTLDR